VLTHGQWLTLIDKEETLCPSAACGDG